MRLFGKVVDETVFLDIRNVIFIGIVACLLVTELFLVSAQPQSFDGWTHLITMSKYHEALGQGKLPVSWVDGIANYGFPLGQVAHQVPSYLGGVLVFLTHDTLLAYNMVWLLGAIFSAWAVYVWLRCEFSPLPALVGAFLFCLTPYRITNIFIRGALPEFWAGVFIPLIGIGLFYWVKKQKHWGWILSVLSTASLALTHPMMMFPGFILLGVYTLYLLWPVWPIQRRTFFSAAQVALILGGGILLASYYLFPLFLETKYFYYGGMDPRAKSFEYLSLGRYFVEQWKFQGVDAIGVRENRIQFGMFESSLMVIVGVWASWKLFRKEKVSQWVVVSLLAAVVGVFFTSNLAAPFYNNIKIIASLQHPWRFFTMLMFVPPVLLAAVIEQMRSQKFQRIGVIVIILILAWQRFPQLYGKNYVAYTDQRYDFSVVNLHSTTMNPIWTGETSSYPVASSSAAIIQGSGTLTETKNDFTTREYTLSSSSEVQVVAYTFYFPGWKLSVDGIEQLIEFQDHQYRGVMTFKVPAGEHRIDLRFTDTKIRLLGKLISGLSLAGLIVAIGLACTANHWQLYLHKFTRKS